MSGDRAGNDDGSVLLLTLGYALLAIALVLVCVSATSLYLAQKRVDAAADAAALAGAEGFTLTLSGGTPRATLTDAGIRVSLFIAPDERQLEAALQLGAPVGRSTKIASTPSARPISWPMITPPIAGETTFWICPRSSRGSFCASASASRPARSGSISTRAHCR